MTEQEYRRIERELLALREPPPAEGIRSQVLDPFTRKITSRKDDFPAGELVELECGHAVTRILKTPAEELPCTECLREFLELRKRSAP